MFDHLIPKLVKVTRASFPSISYKKNVPMIFRLVVRKSQLNNLKPMNFHYIPSILKSWHISCSGPKNPWVSCKVASAIINHPQWRFMKLGIFLRNEMMCLLTNIHVSYDDVIFEYTVTDRIMEKKTFQFTGAACLW
jgi:hypothetical protein